MKTPIYFYVPGADTGQLEGLSPDRDWAKLMNARDEWTTQTFLRLREAGIDVALISRPPAQGVVVSHTRRVDDLIRGLASVPFTVVSIRGEVLPARRDADWEVVQNRRAATQSRTTYIPVWPQADLRRRDPARGTAIRRIGYMGFPTNLHSYFQSQEWRESLEARSIEWVPRFDPESGWNDFSDLDLVVAVRPGHRRNYPGKPATKLVNAWTAGVPALVGIELPFREVRRSALDFVELSAPRDALLALDDLARSPGRYEAMIQNGLARSAEYSAAITTDRWVEMLNALATDRPRMLSIRRTGWRWIRRARLAATRSVRRTGP